MKQQQKKGNNILTFTKGERVAILTLTALIAIMMTLSVFPPRRRRDKAQRVNTEYLDSLIACQTSGIIAQEKHNSSQTADRPTQTMEHPKATNYKTQTKGYKSGTTDYRQASTDNKQEANGSRSHPPEAQRMSLELNAADSTQLIELPQIGEVMASRIQRYRERLGGFVDFEQLYEVKGMDTARYETILPYLTLSDEGIRKLEINRATFKELLRHPYLEYEQVKAIVQYREKKGLFKSWEQVKTTVPDVNPRLKYYLEY